MKGILIGKLWCNTKLYTVKVSWGELQSINLQHLIKVHVTTYFINLSWNWLGSSDSNKQFSLKYI